MHDLRNVSVPEVLMLLFNAAHSTSLPVSRKAEENMDLAEAKVYVLKMQLESNFYIRHLKGRLLDLDFSGESLDTTRYDIANGAGTSEAALMEIYKGAGNAA